MEIGDIITVNVRACDHIKITQIHARVYQMYDRFCVLDTGKYKTCAFYTDLKAKIPIVV